MKIHLDRHFLENRKYVFYHLKSIEDGDKVLSLIKKGILTLNDSLTLDIGNNEINKPCVCLIQHKMIDNGDYNYEDEYIPNYREQEYYIEIFYCPILGEKIEFLFDNDIEDDKNIQKIRDELFILSKNRKSKKRDKQMNVLQEKLNYYYTSHFF